MTEIRIRHEFAKRGAVLGDVPLDEIDTVIPIISRWGLYDDEGNVDPSRLSGQFWYSADANAACFEVLIEAEATDD
ncbi:hypothetical protein [Gordonia sp. SND2]|uniref:hypothetical protein n=1 Tax=Gordonia sp. SND2 TaxID=3388659 RepID=UPI00398B3C5B